MAKITSATGAEIKAFYGWWEENWKEWYHETEDGLYEVEDWDGKFLLKLRKTYKLGDFGPLVWQGLDQKCPIADGEWDFEDAYNEYLRLTAAVKTKVYTLVIPEDHNLILERIVEEHGWKLG